MTRTLVISDVHGNSAALHKVLGHAYRYFAPTEVWCLGDTVGYGPDPAIVWRTLRNEPIPPGGWLAGNHDWGLVEKLNLGGEYQVNENGETLGIQNFRAEAWQVLLHQQETFAPQSPLRRHLQSLPVMSQVRPGIYLTHGAFLPAVERAITQYLVTKEMTAPLASPMKMVAHFQQAADSGTDHVYVNGEPSPAQLFAFGHNHIPGLWRWQDERWQPLALDEPQSLVDLVAAPLCLNPGSVGFPRNGLGCPSYALIDWVGERLQTGAPAITLQYVPYNVSDTRAKMSKVPYVALLQEEQFLPEPRCSDLR